MKRYNTRILVFALLVLFALGQIQNLALAAPQAELTLTTDAVDILPGNTVTVTFTFTSKEEDISIVQASIEYDADILEYRFGGNAVELSKGIGGIQDNLPPGMRTISYDIRFTAIKPGKAKVTVNQSQLIGYDTGSVLGEPTASTVVSVSKPAVQPGDDIDVEQPGDQTPDDWIETELDGHSVYIVRDLSDVVLPQGFVLEHSMYGGEEIQVARDPARDLSLIYIREQGFSSFYIYDHGLIYPYINMDIEAQYTVLKSQEKPSDCVETVLMLDDKPAQAWVSDRYGDDFYIVYAINSIGSKGYYLYDARDGSMQRLITEYNNVNTNDEEN
jgi:hypothetical protein